jgi:hypothetical protein
MASNEEDLPRGGASALSTIARHRARRRTWVVAGVAGLAATLGGGAYLTTATIVNDDTNATQEITLHKIEPSNSATGGGTSSSSPTPILDGSPSPLPSHVAEEIKEARRKMAKDGVAVKPPVPQRTTDPNVEVERTEEGHLQKGGILRVLSARTDLTGQQELAGVAGGIKKYRNVPCTQTFRFSTNPAPKKRENLLMCWRTTPNKSVVAIVVDPEGKPSRDEAVSALEKKWRSMD